MTQLPPGRVCHWLSRLLAFSIALNALLLIEYWYDLHTSSDNQQQHVQLFRANLDGRDAEALDHRQVTPTNPHSHTDQIEEDVTANSKQDHLEPKENETPSRETDHHQDNTETDASNPITAAPPTDPVKTEKPPTTISTADNLLKGFYSNEGPSTFGIPHFTCLGWRQTGDCVPDGPREKTFDGDCDLIVEAGLSGYCLLRNDDTGEEVQAMRTSCSSLRQDVVFTCREAADFARVSPQFDALINATPQQTSSQVASEPSRGILMAIYPKLLQSVYATIRLLRSNNCSLPVELWYLESEMGTNPLKTSKVLQSLVQDQGLVSLHGIEGSAATGFNSKIVALAHSKLDQVLFLDADNSPVRDPTYLFTTPEFEQTGAIFWPDFWFPGHTIFNIKQESLLWELVGTPYVNMFEQESGQLLVDRRRSTTAIKVLQLMALRKPDYFEGLKLAYGDKDLFRLAWLRTNTTFHMISTPAASAGMLRDGRFCGMTMVQYDPKGDVLFLHHNGRKLIDGVGTRVWTHLQSFLVPGYMSASQKYDYITNSYVVDIEGHDDLFPEVSMCYGNKYLTSPYFQLTDWDRFPWHDIEARLHAFVQDVRLLE